VKINSILGEQNRFPLALNLSCLVGVFTIGLVYSVGISGHTTIAAIAKFIGDGGNDLFLISTNLLIIGWAWRQRLISLIQLSLWLDFIVWLTVQGIKLLQIAPWTLRPTGAHGGFPSGHATHAFAMAFLLTMLFPRLAWFWYTCAAAISWSRLESLAHADFQIAAGVILGITIGWLLISRWLIHPEAAAFAPKRNSHIAPVPANQTYIVPD
jgi:membrane-associated phospholipid phosphatase